MDLEARVSAAGVAVAMSLLASAAVSVAMVRLSFRSHCQWQSPASDEAGNVKEPAAARSNASSEGDRAQEDETSRLRYGAVLPFQRGFRALQAGRC